MQLASRFASRSPSLRSDSPLSDDQIRRVAPSIFADAPHESRSERYSYIPTAAVLTELHHAGHTLISLRGCQQVKVIAHQHIGMNGHAKRAGLLVQQIQKSLKVASGNKYRLPVIAALNDVMWVTGERQTGKACHRAPKPTLAT